MKYNHRLPSELSTETADFCHVEAHEVDCVFQRGGDVGQPGLVILVRSWDITCSFPHLSSQKGVIYSMTTTKHELCRCTVGSRVHVKVLPQKLTPHHALLALIWGVPRAKSPVCRSCTSKHRSETLWITGFRNGVKKLSHNTSEFGVIERDLTHHSPFWLLFVYTIWYHVNHVVSTEWPFPAVNRKSSLCHVFACK